jgi:glycosyltransferase involved in cell wall biosynthesis
MKVLHITAIGAGGAGIACLRQQRALVNAGIESKVLLLYGRHTPAEGVYSVEATDPAFKKTMRQYKRQRALLNVKVRLNGKTPELFSSPHTLWRIEEHPLVKEADIIHLHWVAGMIDLQRFFTAVKKPIVWTLHDAWPYSGGFHYERYWDPARFGKLSEEGLKIRKQLFHERKMQIVSPSEYLLNECRNSGVFANSEFHHIHNCMNVAPNENTEHNSTAKPAGIKQRWIFCCDELDYFRKGADLLFDAVTQWENDSVQLTVVGQPGSKKVPDDPRIQFTGHVGPERVAALLRNSDVLVHPSREDNLPNVIVEALCVGVPVLATPAGGVPEMIIHGKNGWLTSDVSRAALLKVFDEMLHMQFDREQIAKEAQQMYTPQKFSNTMQVVYARL